MTDDKKIARVKRMRDFSDLIKLIKEHVKFHELDLSDTEIGHLALIGCDALQKQREEMVERIREELERRRVLDKYNYDIDKGFNHGLFRAIALIKGED